MINNNDDNFDDIDLDEIFNDFNDNPPSLLTKSDLKPKTNQDDLIEFNENDCTAPRIIHKRTKPKNKTNAKQTTMYDYASSISYKHKQFYSSLDNTTTTKMIIKGQKRSLTDCQPSSSSSNSKKKKTIDYENLSSSPVPTPDFIDSLLKYLDERSRTTTEDEMPKKKIPNSI